MTLACVRRVKGEDCGLPARFHIIVGVSASTTGTRHATAATYKGVSYCDKHAPREATEMEPK